MQRKFSDQVCGAEEALLGLHPRILGSTGNMSFDELKDRGSKLSSMIVG